MPSAPISVPTVMKMRIIAMRLAPIVLRIAISFVLERTSMMSDDRMLNTATNMMIDSTQNMRSEEHTSELQSLMRISYAVFCLKKKSNLLHNIYKATYHYLHQ